MGLAKVSPTGIAVRVHFNQGVQMSPVPLTRRVLQSVNPDESPHDADGFVGVDPVYQNFANDTDAPLGEGDDVVEDDEDWYEDDDESKAEESKAEESKAEEFKAEEFKAEELKATPVVVPTPVVVVAPKPTSRPVVKEKPVAGKL